MTKNNEKPLGSGLMMFWADIDIPHVLRYQEWHNCEHIPERVSIPGFRNGRRYRSFDHEAQFVMFYETDTASVFNSQPYLNALNNPTPWTKEALTYFREPVRNIYELINSMGERGDFVPSYLATLRFNLDTARQDELVKIHANDWLTALCDLDHVSEARLYQVDEEISSIMTSERKIYGGGPGQQKYLAFIAADRPFDEIGNPIQAASEKIFGAESGRIDEFTNLSWLEISHEKSDT
ncbi:DUF4286 family protein [uncultured Sneathiella sp.]|uniref:DUF4286 family protein n=1 Tax=uncultured Sneathiella sp. TaxID=879315 RepID=UPI0025968C36|nr:DUF4286 family protein [uncultured Sneathiella sp.]